MIYAVDFDDTLAFTRYSKTEVGLPNKPLIEFLINSRQNGDKVILWTCRINDALTQAVEFCKGMGLEFDAVNDNLPEVKMLFEKDPRKVYADIYIDDAACQVDDFVRQKCRMGLH
jgi:hypothetical protein